MVDFGLVGRMVVVGQQIDEIQIPVIENVGNGELVNLVNALLSIGTSCTNVGHLFNDTMS